MNMKKYWNKRRQNRVHDGVNRDRIWARMWRNIYAKMPAAEWAGEEVEVCPEEDLSPEPQINLEF